MITVIRKTVQHRKLDDFPESSASLISGIVNWRLTTHPHIWCPPTDIYETEDSIIVRVEIAGMKESEFSIFVDQNALSISGSRADINERRAFHQMAIHFGEFHTGAEISVPIEINNVTAEYRDGFLIVILPKAQPKQINVNK